METKISTNGQVVLPCRLRRRLGLQAGDSLDAELDGGRVILTPKKGRPRRTRIVRDPMTGLPALSLSGKAPRLTNEQVRDVLAEFP